MRRTRAVARMGAVAGLLAALALAPAASAEPTTTLISTTDPALSPGAPFGDGASDQPVVSADGRYVAFQSQATDLVEDDANGAVDIFRRDVQSGETIRVSVMPDGSEIADPLWTMRPAISADGNRVAFATYAGIVAEDTDGDVDVYVRDVDAGTTTLVSAEPDGTSSEAEASVDPSISADGELVAFSSGDANLVADDANGAFDVFVRDLSDSTTTRVSVASDGTESDDNADAPTISADGTHVAFHSSATNLVADDGNGVQDVFVHDLDTAATERVSVSSDGSAGNGGSSFDTAPSAGALTSDGRLVVFRSQATNLTEETDANGAGFDVFLRDRDSGTTTLLSVAVGGTTTGDDESVHAAISADGSTVALASYARDLVGGDAGETDEPDIHSTDLDVFVRDVAGDGPLERITLAPDGSEADGDSQLGTLGETGRLVSLASEATNLTADTAGATVRQVLLHDQGAPPPPDYDVDLESGVGDWGVKESFRNYITGSIAHGDVTLSGGAVQNDDGTYGFPVTGGSYESATGAATVELSGTVRFRGHETPPGSGNHLLLMTIADPRVTIAGDSGILYADVSSRSLGTGEVVDYPDVAFADLDLSAVEPVTTEEEVTWEAIPVALREEGVAAFADFYAAGTALDPITLTASKAESDEEPPGGDDPPGGGEDPPGGGGDPPGGGQQPPGGDPPPADEPDPPAKPSEANRRPLIGNPKRPRRVRRNGVAAITRIACRTGPCRVRTTRRARVRIGKRTFRARVIAPKRVRAGKRTRVRVRLSRAARRALLARRRAPTTRRRAIGRVRFRVVVRSRGGMRTVRTIRATIR